ncbi:hypothetical protein ACQP2T_11555 [Nonomuraea sp. CA-143628]|uniref:hypothetical protein n=1 Tax=Nonomuraea sp. CA-143628 TaxID=3239997 RepID=UPI003D8BBB4F
MGKLRMFIAFGLAMVSAGAIVWCTVAARPVPLSTRSDSPAVPEPWELEDRGDPQVKLARQATTEVKVTRAGPGDLSAVPQGRLDERQRQVKVTVTHRLRMNRADPLVETLRQGGSFPGGIQRFTDDGFGAIKVGGDWLAPTTRPAPILTTTGGLTTAEFRVTLLRQFKPSDLMTLDFTAPSAKPLIVSQRTISLLPGDWTVLQAQGLDPELEESELLRFTVGSYLVKVTLAQDSYGFPDAEEADDFSWTAGLGVLTAIALAAFLARSLGLAWWNRQPNRELLLGIALITPLVLLPLLAPDWRPVAYVALFLALPALTARHASRALPTSPPWTTRDMLVVTGLACLVGIGMLSWSWLHEQLPAQTLLIGSVVAAVTAAAAAVVFSVDLGVRVVIVRLAVLAAEAAIGLLALALWGRALLTGVYPPDSIRLVLALGWAVIPVAAIAVATKMWTRTAVVGAVLVSLLVQGWPTEWLDSGSWNLPFGGTDMSNMPKIGILPLDPLVRGVLGLLLLAFALLVLRLRRLGGSLAALDHPATHPTVIACLMVLYLTPRGSTTLTDANVALPQLTITSIAAWVTARWLLVRPHPAVVEPTTAEEHRQLVRAALHKRLLLISEQELYRIGRGKLGAGELTMTEFDTRRHELEAALEEHGRHPETALATAAGCTPWHNGVYAFVISLLLSLPFVLVFGWPTGADLSSFVFDSRYLLTLPAFGFVFGYFYPRVRGTQPMTKALHLMAAALVTELSAYLPTLFEPDIGVAVKVQVVAIVVGEVALVCIGLGLYWEWRVMHLAGEPWARVRNVRSVRSLATPLLAVVIAAGTTAATSAAGQTVDRILKGDQVSSSSGP